MEISIFNCCIMKFCNAGMLPGNNFLTMASLTIVLAGMEWRQKVGKVAPIEFILAYDASFISFFLSCIRWMLPSSDRFLACSALSFGATSIVLHVYSNPRLSLGMFLLIFVLVLVLTIGISYISLRQRICRR